MKEHRNAIQVSVYPTVTSKKELFLQPQISQWEMRTPTVSPNIVGLIIVLSEYSWPNYGMDMTYRLRSHTVSPLVKLKGQITQISTFIEVSKWTI